MLRRRLLRVALAHFRVSSAIVLGHSWGTSELQSQWGLKYPAWFGEGSGIRILLSHCSGRRNRDGGGPVVGDILSHTVSPLMSRAIWSLMRRKIFGRPLQYRKNSTHFAEGNGRASVSEIKHRPQSPP